MRQESNQLGYVFIFLTMLIWAGFVIMGRIAGTSPLNAFDVTALRFGVAAAVLFPVWFFWKRVPLFTKPMFLFAATGGFTYSLIAYGAFRFAPASHGAVLISGMLPFFVPLCAWLIMREAPRASAKLSIPLVAMGLVFLSIDVFANAKGTFLGDAMMVLASIIWAIYTVLVRKYSNSPWETTIGGVLLSALLYLPVYLLLLPKGLFDVPLSTVAVQGFYQGILVVIVAMVLYMAAIDRLGSARVGSAMALVPALAGVGSVVLLKESMSVWLISGFCMTSIGAWWGARQ